MLLESLAASSIILASAAVAPNAAPWCKAAQQPVVRVGLIAPTPSGDFSKDMKQLEAYKIDTVNPYGVRADTHVGGLTSGTVKVEQTMGMGGMSYGPQSCIWFTKIDVIIRLDQRVYVAKDYPKGSCMHEAVWEHEHKHVRVDREIINQYRPAYEQAVRAFIAKYPVVGPVRKGQEKSLQKQMITALKQSVASVTNRMENERGARQQTVDTRAEYDRVSAVCKGKK